MKTTIFGASGGVGGHLVRQSLDAGHTVTAVVRDGGARFEVSHAALDVVVVPGLTDLDPDVLRPALVGRDAVLSAVGARGRHAGLVASRATRAILRAMEVGGVRRFVGVSAAPVGPVPDGESFVNRRILLPVVSAVLREVYADLAAMEDELRRSHLEWTVVRPPRLVDKPLTGSYRMIVGANVPRGATISRGDVAHAMLAAVRESATVGQPVGVAY